MEKEIEMLVSKISEYIDYNREMSMNNKFRNANEKSIKEMQNRLDYLYKLKQ